MLLGSDAGVIRIVESEDTISLHEHSVVPASVWHRAKKRAQFKLDIAALTLLAAIGTFARVCWKNLQRQVAAP